MRLRRTASPPRRAASAIPSPGPPNHPHNHPPLVDLSGEWDIGEGHGRRRHISRRRSLASIAPSTVAVAAHLDGARLHLVVPFALRPAAMSFVAVGDRAQVDGGALEDVEQVVCNGGERRRRRCSRQPRRWRVVDAAASAERGRSGHLRDGEASQRPRSRATSARARRPPGSAPASAVAVTPFRSKLGDSRRR